MTNFINNSLSKEKWKEIIDKLFEKKEEEKQKAKRAMEVLQDYDNKPN